MAIPWHRWNSNKSLLIHAHNMITTISLSTKIMRLYATIESLEDAD
jgi:hypothetical protein